MDVNPKNVECSEFEERTRPIVVEGETVPAIDLEDYEIPDGESCIKLTPNQFEAFLRSLGKRFNDKEVD